MMLCQYKFKSLLVLALLLTYSLAYVPVLRPDCHSFSVDGSQVGIFKNKHEIRLASFLPRVDHGRQLPQVHPLLLCNFTDEPLVR